ncbi:transcriptional regulator [Bacillus cereus]|nr:transcriptional regulator [Bacillus cereus]PFW08778.1 transcriptional regulator [Bacillus cereus]PGW92593.1 transcriptional regulator [Bacillus cereus]
MELRKYSQFNSINEMDESIQQYLEKYDLSERDLTVLWKIASYSCKFPGVSYLKVNTLANLTGYVKRTIQRALKSLTEKGIITRVELFKPVKGGYSAFITVINPFDSHVDKSPREEAVEPTPEYIEEDLTHRDTINLKAKTLNNNTYVDEDEKLKAIVTHSGQKDMCNVNTLQGNNELGLTHLVASGVPSEFAISALPFFDATVIYKLWSKTLLAVRKHATSLPEEDIIEQAVSSVKALVLNMKTKRVRDHVGYYYSVAVSKLAHCQRKISNFLVDYFK